jgi:hypothetical protein
LFKITTKLLIIIKLLNYNFFVRVACLETLSNCTFFSKRTAFSTTLSRLAYNGMAAWRSGGIYALPFKSALPAAVAPNRTL